MLAVCVSGTLLLFIHDMHQLSDIALEAILKEWNPQEYDPPNTNIREWTHTIESLCDTYGIPDTQRPQCAARFIEGALRTEFEDVLRDSRARFGPIRWAQFTNFMVAFDRKRVSITIEPSVTEILQAISGRHGRVGAPFLVVRRSALIRAPPNRPSILRTVPKTHRFYPRDHWFCPVDSGRCRWYPHCCGFCLRGHRRR